MDLARRSGTMEASIRAFTRMPLKRAKVSTVGLIRIGLSASGETICLMVVDYSYGTMIDFSLVTGKTI